RTSPGDGTASHSGALARVRGPVRPDGSLRRLLVHVLAHRKPVPAAARSGEPRGLPVHRSPRPTARAARLRGRPRGRLVPGHAPGGSGLPRASAAASAAPGRTGVVGLVLLHPPGLPAARGQRGAPDRGDRARPGRRGAGPGGLPVRRGARRDTAARLHGRRLDIRPRRLPACGREEPGPADHAAHVPPAVLSAARPRLATSVPLVDACVVRRGARRHLAEGSPATVCRRAREPARPWRVATTPRRSARLSIPTPTASPVPRRCIRPGREWLPVCRRPTGRHVPDGPAQANGPPPP